MGNLHLSELNRRVSSPAAIRLAAICVFLAALLVYVASAHLQVGLGTPPPSGDGVHYDAIALQLSKGKGFSINWGDPDLRAPYLEHNGAGEYELFLNLHWESPTAYRPPLFPVLMAASYKIFGHSFGPIRIMNSIFMALACALAFMLLARRFGLIPGLLFAVLFVIVDYRSRFYARDILTEATACLLVTTMFWSLVRAAQTRDRKWGLFLGVVTGLAFLTRTMFLLWVPTLAITLLALTKRKGERWLSAGSLRLPLLFVAAFLVVSAPWMLRNCLLVGRFEPLGTMGGANMPAAYSDKALARNGVWFNLELDGFFDQLPEDLTGLELEQAKVDYGSSVALRWIFRNPLKVALLALLKARSEWVPHGLQETLLLGFGALGFLVLLSSRRREAVAVFGLLAACTLAVAATWSSEGRFLIPVLPIISALSSVGLWAFLVSTTELPLDRLKAATLDADEGGEQRAGES